jgi:hypothetical protein
MENVLLPTSSNANALTSWNGESGEIPNPPALKLKSGTGVPLILTMLTANDAKLLPGVRTGHDLLKINFVAHIRRVNDCEVQGITELKLTSVARAIPAGVCCGQPDQKSV